MRQFSKAQDRIIKLLSQSSGKLDSYTLFRRSKVSFESFFKAYLKLLEQGIIEETDNSAFFTIKGSKVVREKMLTAHSTAKPWRHVPDHYIGSSIDINSFYVPSISLLDKNTFKLLKDTIDKE